MDNDTETERDSVLSWLFEVRFGRIQATEEEIGKAIHYFGTSAGDYGTTNKSGEAASVGGFIIVAGP